MAILATLPGVNLFSNIPSNPPPNHPKSPNPQPPIPIPKYPPPQKPRKTPKPSKSPIKPSNPAFKTFHHRSKYYKPVSDGVISGTGDRCVIVGESGVSYLLPGAPFEFQFSYSETPKVKPVAIREPAFLPFAPPTMTRPWTGKAPLQKSKKNIPLFDSFNPPPAGMKGVKHVEMPGPFPMGKFPVEGKTRNEILGEPLKRSEHKMLVKPYLSDNRQVNLGRDGLTHNMLELVHSHWKRQRVCKVKCKGVPTVDMDNVCRHLEEKTGGKIIHRVGGVVYLFRGRNYNYRTRPQYPVMLWKPAAPVYPKLIQEAPEGLTKEEADELRKKGKKLKAICKLAKNGVYITLVKDVKDAFEGSILAKIDCKGMHASDYKRIGAKLKELVPCVLLSFDNEQILMWRGRGWKSMYPEARSSTPPSATDITNLNDHTDVNGTTDSKNELSQVSEELVQSKYLGNSNGERAISSPRMMSLWKRAIDSSKALLLDDVNLRPNDLLKKVEEFESTSQAAEHSYPALISTSEPVSRVFYSDVSDDDEDIFSDDDSEGLYEEAESSVPLGSLPIDRIAEQLNGE